MTNSFTPRNTSDCHGVTPRKVLRAKLTVHLYSKLLTTNQTDLRPFPIQRFSF